MAETDSNGSEEEQVIHHDLRNERAGLTTADHEETHEEVCLLGVVVCCLRCLGKLLFLFVLFYLSLSILLLFSSLPHLLHCLKL